jgi:hypothetical protein
LRWPFLFGTLPRVLRLPPVAVEVLPVDRVRALGLLSRGSWLAGHLERLGALPSHGNRRLHADQLFKGLLLAFFDPFCRSLRLIQDKGDFAGGIDLPRLARSTTSDALALIDPACLLPVIDDLRRRVPQLNHADQDLAQITRRIIANDGTYLSTLADVAWALKQTRRDGRKMGQVRANVQMDIANWAPQVVTVSGDDETSEPAAFAKDLLCGVLYVMDRNFLDFDFLIQLLARDNDFVLRVRGNAPAVKVLQDLPLSAADVEADVSADQIVELTGRGAPQGRFRLVTITTLDRHGKVQVLRLLSNLTDPQLTAARVIGAIYKQRWQIELFFKWLKTFARMDHLLSTSRNGITFQLYVAVIAVLMITVQTGRRVSIYALAALGRLARGECTLEQAMAVIAAREREAELNRARQARHRARKKLA